MTELIVTNLNRNFTGVSATSAGVVRHQKDMFDMALAGHALPGCPGPVTMAQARALSRAPSNGRPHVIWHVRRNLEMRAGIWARDMLRLPIKLVFTSAAIRRHSAYPRWLISKMDAVIATTDEAADFVPHVRAVVPHGVDCLRFQPATDRSLAWAKLGYPGTRGIATIGRIRPEKGTDRFVDTMLRVLPDHPGITALVIGRAKPSDQGFLDGLKHQIKTAGMSDRILFPGELPAEDLPQLLQGLDLLVQLPRYEGYGMVPLEAMASGVPFVATDTGYYQSFATQGCAGVITGPDASGAVTSLLSDQNRFAQMAIEAQKVASESFSIECEVAGIARVYEDVWGSL